MTFGEKIQKLRKEAGLSQEELSYQMGVSRQAISKWERDSGYPETEKIVRMSKIFNVTLDYLLNEEDGQHKEIEAERGIYVSREMAEGFLTYQKLKFLKIAAAAGSMVAGTSFPLLFPDIASHLFLLATVMVMIIGIVLLASVKLTDNPYQKLKKEPLLFDKAVKAELNVTYAEKKKSLQLWNLVGITCIASGLLLFPLLVSTELLSADEIALGTGMIAVGIGTFLCIYMSGMLWSYHLLLGNEDEQKGRR